MAPPRSPASPSSRSSVKDTGPDWQKIMSLATGCADEYIKTGGSSVRLTDGNLTGKSGRTSDAEHVTAMQEGLPVLFYVDGVGFEQRILKVDNRLSFCYVLPVGGKMDKLNTLVIPLPQVRVHEAEEAVNMCKSSGISDPSITYDTTVVVSTVPNQDGLQTNSADVVYVFVAPPRTLLKDRLKACCMSTAGHPKTWPQEGQQQEKEHMPRLDGVRLKDPLVLYMKPKFVEVEVQYLTPLGHPGGRLVRHRLKLPLPLKKISEEIVKIEEKGSTLSAVDRARVQYVLREMATIQSWAKSFGRCFMFDFLTFINESVVKKVADDDWTEESIGQIRGAATVAHCCQTPTLPDEDKYSKVYLCALLAALRQSMELDDEIVKSRQKEQQRISEEQELAEQELEKSEELRTDEEMDRREDLEHLRTRKSKRPMGMTGVISDLGLNKWLPGSEAEGSDGAEDSQRGPQGSSWFNSWLPKVEGDKPEAGQRASAASDEASPAASPRARKSFSSRSFDDEPPAAVPPEGKMALVHASRAKQPKPQAPVLLGAQVAKARTCMSIGGDASLVFAPELGDGEALPVPAFKVKHRAPGAPVLLGAGAAVQASPVEAKPQCGVGAVRGTPPSPRYRFNAVSSESMLGKVFGASSSNELPSIAGKGP